MCLDKFLKEALFIYPYLYGAVPSKVKIFLNNFTKK